MISRAIFMRFPEGRAKALTFSYDDGVKSDVRFVELLNRYGMKGTFNLNSECYAGEDGCSPHGNVTRRMTREQTTALFADGCHEVAVHTATHPLLTELPISAVTYEVLKDRENLEGQFGKIVRGMAYPYGPHNDGVVDALRACGIAYARTVISTEKFKMPTDWLRLETTCHHKNKRLMELARQFVERKSREPLMFYLWGHTYEFDDDNNWEVIEEFVDFMGGREDTVWYATNMEIYEYTKAYEQLIWSADASMVYNPTGVILWLQHYETVHAIRPGQTLRLGEND